MSKDSRDYKFKEVNINEIIVNLKLWFIYLLKKCWIIMPVVLVAATAGFFYAKFTKPVYASHLTFALEDGEGGMGGAMSLAAEFGLNIGSAKNIFEGDNILTLLTSRRILERVLLSVDTVNGSLITMADYYKKINEDTIKTTKDELSAEELRLIQVSFPANQPRSSFSYLQDSVLKNLYIDFSMGGVSATKPDKKLNLYELSVISVNERFTKVFTDRLMKEVTDFYIELKTKKSKATLDILEDRVSDTKGALNNAITSHASIQDVNLNPAFQQAQAQLQKKQVDISAYGGAYGEMYKNLELARFQYLKDIPLLQIIDAADYPMNRVKKSKLKTALLYATIVGMLSILFFTAKYFIKSKLNSLDSQTS